MPRSSLLRSAFAAALTAGLVATASPSFAATSTAAQPASIRPAAAVKHLSSPPTPRISGSGSIGAALKAVPGTWRPGHVTLRYQWLSNGLPVSGATGSRFTVRAVDAGRAITVTVRGSRHGYRTVTRISRSLRIKSAAAAPPPVSAPPVSTPPVSAPPVSAPPVSAPPVSTPPVTTPPVTTPPPSNVAISGGGDFLVGSAVAPGTYVTTGSTASCYWARVSSFDGQYSSIIDNDLGSGQRIITILPTDYGVEFSDCGSWVRSANAPAIGAVQDGTYLVGAQVPAGEYRAIVPATAVGGCYWATLSAFTGSLHDILTNDIVSSGTVVVDIPSTVAGFESSGCGTWTRIG